MSRAPLSIYDPDAVRRFFDREGLPSRYLRVIYGDFLKRGLGEERAFARLPEGLRNRLERDVALSPLRLRERRDSRIDGATKLLLETRAGAAFETVVLRFPRRTSLCVSSQVGCALRCRFCATGLMGKVTNLTSDEILAQVTAGQEVAAQDGRLLRNLVFMGMGEPLQNEEALHRALERLQDGRLFNFPPRALLVSTVGLPEPMRRLNAHFPRVRLALSLHSSRQEVRESIMPVAKTVSVEDLRETLRSLEVGSKGVLIEVLALDGLNDSDEDVDHLADYLRGLPVHINLIPFNPLDRPLFTSGPISGVELRPSADARVVEMADRLRGHGFSVTRRYSLGRDIDAACGQLIEDASNSR